MNKKLQVFVSSTYTDLIEERQAAVEAILDAGHIPAGMEIFPASNNSLSQTLFKIIDTSDVYVLILGNRYGSIDQESGISYTQLEYTYAISKNMPVVAIVLDDNGIYERIHNDNNFDSPHSELYNKFRESVLSKIATIVKNRDEIKYTIINFLNEYSVLNPSIGWGKYPYDQSVNNFVQALYQQNPTNFISLFNGTDISNKFKQYFEIYKSFEIESISNVTANKCIIDSLGNPINDISEIRIDVSEVNDWMLNELRKNPTDLYKLSPRRFEELIAEVLMRKGYSVELTPVTRDGGKDIYVARKDDLGSFLYLVECKHYEPTHKVGVSVIRDLYGVLSKEKATYGIVVTSDFTKPAQDFQQDIKFQMSLKNFNSIQKWICDVT